MLRVDNRKTKRALIDMINLYLWAAHYVTRVFVERFLFLLSFRKHPCSKAILLLKGWDFILRGNMSARSKKVAGPDQLYS